MLERAWAACRAFRYDEAEKLFKAAPPSVESLLGLGDVYRYQDRAREAERCYARALELDPADSRAAAKAAEAALSAGRPAQALSRLERARPAARAGLLKGRALEALGREKEALAAYAAAAALPASTYRQEELDRLEALLSARRFKEAFALADALYAAEPTQHGVDGLKTALGLSPRGPAAVSHLPALERHAKARPKDAWAWAVLFYAAIGRGKAAALPYARRLWKAAAGERRWMLVFFSDFPEHFGERFEKLGPELERAAGQAPALWKISASKAEFLFCSGRRDEALEAFDALAARLDGQDAADARAWRGELKLWAGDYAGALADFDAGLAGGARYARGWRGAALACLGRDREALAELDRALKEAPRDPETLTWRGELLRRLGRDAQARRDLSAAVALNGSYWARLNLCLLHEKRGEAAALAAQRAALPAEVAAVPPARALELGRGLRRKEHLFWLAAR